MSNLFVRILSAAVLLSAGFALIILDLRTRWLAIALILIPGAWELSRLVDRKFSAPAYAPLSALAVAALLLPYFPGMVLPSHWDWMIASITLVTFVLLGFRTLPIEFMAPWILMNGFIIAYLGIWSAKLFALTLPEIGWRSVGPLAYTIFCIAAADTGAYAAGRSLGKRKLAPAISSGKTIEGALGGAMAAMAVSLIFGPGLAGLQTIPALILGAVLAGASILGDLFISTLKRMAGAKDTSRIIPGHGGVMDRFDSLTFVAPIAWVGIKLLGTQ